MNDLRLDPATELRRAALELFARDGYDATSLQDVADAVGYTKANVLYHFGSKDSLLEVALTPAIERFEALAIELSELVASAGQQPSENEQPGENEQAAETTPAPANDPAALSALVTQRLVDFLFDYEHAVAIFINQASALRENPLVARANELIARFVDLEIDGGPTSLRGIRASVAIAGAAYCIAQRGNGFGGTDELDDAEFRARLTEAVTSIAQLP